MSLDLGAFLEEFRAEAGEHLRAMDEQLLTLEWEPGAAVRAVRVLFLSAHTLKGGAAMLELFAVRDLTHAVEDVLSGLRDRAEAPDPFTADLLFRAVDALRDLVSRATPGESRLEPAAAELVARLRERAASGTAPLAAAAAAANAPLSAPRALVVEPSATVRLLETMQLEAVGFAVDGAADEATALTLSAAAPYDLVVVALEPGGVDGFGLSARLRTGADGPAPVVVLVSLDSGPEWPERAAAAGAAFVPRGSYRDSGLASTALALYKASAPENRKVI